MHYFWLMFCKTLDPDYLLDLAKFHSAPGLALQAASKTTKVKLELLTNIDMEYITLLIICGIRDRICRYAKKYIKANNKYIKNYDKNKESSYLKYWDVNNLYGSSMSQKFPIIEFEWVKDISQLMKIS